MESEENSEQAIALPVPTNSPPSKPISRDEKEIYYTKIYIEPTLNNPRRLVFISNPQASEPPEDMRALRRDYEKTARIVSVIFNDQDVERKDIFRLLHEAAFIGFVGEHYSVAEGRLNLESVTESIVDSAHIVRDQRLRQYNFLALIVGVLPLLLGVGAYVTNVFGYYAINDGSSLNQTTAWMFAACFIPAGATICVWAEFALRMQSALTFDQLIYMDPSRWRPGQRVLITIGISFVLAFFLSFNVVQLGIGGLLLNDFVKVNPFISLAIGGITGLAFVSVRDVITRVKPEERVQR